ncbi:unnamed protein product, partial [Nesidiocoris tenuis]
MRRFSSASTRTRSQKRKTFGWEGEKDWRAEDSTGRMSYIAGTGRRRQQSKMAAGQRSTSEASKTVSGEHDVQRRRSFGS